jgi:hypothetical protein
MLKNDSMQPSVDIYLCVMDEAKEKTIVDVRIIVWDRQ